jgi:uncharacterized Fe-S cluster protein YjdI
VGKRLQVYQTDSLTVTWDPNLCIHSEVCVRGLPEVFDPAQARWIRPDRAAADRVVDVVGRCPSGALQAKRPGESRPAPSAGVVIRMEGNGPLLVRGRVRVEGASGEVLTEADAVSLCRCGQTGNPPFCDGSHERNVAHNG